MGLAEEKGSGLRNSRFKQYGKRDGGEEQGLGAGHLLWIKNRKKRT